MLHLRHPHRLTVVLAATALIMGAACSDDSPAPTPAPTAAAPAATTAPTEAPAATESPAETPAPTPQAARTPEPPSAGPVEEVAIAGFRLPSATVAVGTQVAWTNEDSAPHTATSVDGVFNSGGLDQGETFRFTFQEAGEFRYICSLHEGMEGTITVQ